jgi:hypothetical protein
LVIDSKGTENITFFLNNMFLPKTMGIPLKSGPIEILQGLINAIYITPLARTFLYPKKQMQDDRNHPACL